ncbi:MAG: hypothetical protein ACLQQ4_01265 [Bacteroidia bacterium]
MKNRVIQRFLATLRNDSHDKVIFNTKTVIPGGTKWSEESISIIVHGHRLN